MARLTDRTIAGMGLITLGHQRYASARVAAKHGQDRLCWFIQKSLDKRSCLLHLKARETEYIPLVKLTPLVLEIDHRDLPNRVTTSFTLVGI
jgi:hypothetical protein